MEKIFEALKRIETTFSMNKEGKESVYREYTNSIYPYYEDFDLVLNALNELKQIKESKPSEALECLEKMYDNIESPFPSDKELYDTIKQYILKAQEQEEVLNVIKEKNIDIETLKYRLRVKDDDVYLHYKYDLLMPREKFELLKRWLEND